MSEENQIDEMNCPKYFYRLRNCDEQHYFHQSDKGIQCPFCKKDVKNILLHLQKNEICADKIDINHFEIMYKVINAESRRKYLTGKKRKEREKKREYNENAYKKEIADEKARQRNKEREKDEAAFRQQRADEKSRERKADREKDEEADKRKIADEKARQRNKEREKDEEAFKRQRANEKGRERNKEREKDEEAFRRKRANDREEERRRQNAKTDATTRLGNFNRAVLFGPIFTCSCCHRKLFENGVTKITGKFKEKVNNKVNYSSIIPEGQEVEVKIIFNGSTELSGLYICHNCRQTLLKGKMPAMAVQNGLQLTNLDSDLQLTELENNLIAHMINFQYIFQLPKSRWGGTKNQMISVPVSQETIQETVNKLPRLPKDAELVPVNLKRKMEYKNSHKKQFINPEKVLKVLQILKTSGHPYYQFCEDLNIDTYKKRCKEQDAQGYELLFEIDQAVNDGEMEDKNSGTEDNLKNDLDPFFKTDRAAVNDEAQEMNSGGENKWVNHLNVQEDEAIRRMTDPDMIRMYGYRTDDGVDTTDIIIDGTCFRVTYIDEYGEDEVKGAPEGSDKDAIIDEVRMMLSNVHLQLSEDLKSENHKIE
jgi:hypothetical protein